jgi:hypothetical protein
LRDFEELLFLFFELCSAFRALVHSFRNRVSALGAFELKFVPILMSFLCMPLLFIFLFVYQFTFWLYFFLGLLF